MVVVVSQLEGQGLIPAPVVTCCSVLEQDWTQNCFHCCLVLFLGSEPSGLISVGPMSGSQKGPIPNQHPGQDCARPWMGDPLWQHWKNKKQKEKRKIGCHSISLVLTYRKTHAQGSLKVSKYSEPQSFTNSFLLSYKRRGDQRKHLCFCRSCFSISHVYET